MEWKNIIIIVMIIVVTGLISCFFLFFRNKKKEIALSLFSIVFALFISEFIIRLFYPQMMEHNKMFEYDASLGWKFVANKRGNIIYPGEAHHYIETNERGFRDDPPRASKDKRKKILVIGDSFVSNIAVKDNEVFTEVLEDSLKNIEVLNFGVNGYGQVQEYLVLQQWYNKIKPDLLVLMIYIRNDFQDNIGGNWLYPRPYASWNEDQTLTINPTPQLAAKKVTSVPIWRMYRKSHLYMLLKRRVQFFQAKFSPKNQDEPSFYTPPELYLCRSQLSENTKLMYRTMEELLLRIATFSDKVGVPIVFAIAPSMVQVEDELWSSTIQNASRNLEDYTRTLPNDKLMQFAKDNQLQMIDLLPTLRLTTKKGKTLYNPKEQHWNSDGNQVVAHILLNYLKTSPFIE